jgi:hypothetical protein
LTIDFNDPVARLQTRFLAAEFACTSASTGINLRAARRIPASDGIFFVWLKRPVPQIEDFILTLIDPKGDAKVVCGSPILATSCIARHPNQAFRCHQSL